MFENVLASLNWFLKLTPVPLLALAIACSFLAFAPEHTLTALGVEALRREYRPIIGIVLIVASSYLFAHFLWWTGGQVVQRRMSGRQRKAMEHSLHELTASEKDYLAPYVIEGIPTRYFPIEDGVAGGLRAKGILFLSSNAFNITVGPPHSLHPWARRYLEEHPELITDIDLAAVIEEAEATMKGRGS